MPKRKADEASTDSADVTQDGKIAVRAGEASKRINVKHDNLVDTVNGLPPDVFRSKYIKDEWLNHQPLDRPMLFNLDPASADELQVLDYVACYNLVERTSRPDYEASASGWHPRIKRREMKDHDMRYLLVRQLHPRPSPVESESEVTGFLSYMITHDSTPSVPALYIYEIHLSEPLRKLGLGAHLLQVAENIARRIGLTKVMLTCFLSNEAALGFYKKRGLGTDECSPRDRTTRNKVMKVVSLSGSSNKAVQAKADPKKKGPFVMSIRDAKPSLETWIKDLEKSAKYTKANDGHMRALMDVLFLGPGLGNLWGHYFWLFKHRRWLGELRDYTAKVAQLASDEIVTMKEEADHLEKMIIERQKREEASAEDGVEGADHEEDEGSEGSEEVEDDDDGDEIDRDVEAGEDGG